MTEELELRQTPVKIALKFEQPWDVTGDLADCWLMGTLGDGGRVTLELPVAIDGGQHVSVFVRPRYCGESFSNLEHGQPIIVDQKIETPDGDLLLIGSIRQT